MKYGECVFAVQDCNPTSYIWARSLDLGFTCKCYTLHVESRITKSVSMIIAATAAHVEPFLRELNASIAFERLKHLPHCCWFDSALVGDKQSRYSFLAADPVDVLRVDRVVADPLAKFEQWIDQFQSITVPGLPPFQGGVAGFMGYELGRCFERVPAAKHNEFDLPLATLALYDVVLAWDHMHRRGMDYFARVSRASSPKHALKRASIVARPF